MFWVDDIADQIEKAFPDKDRLIVVRDEKTASGRVHVGSVRGVVIHGVIAQALRERGRKAQFYYEINDVDPMDGMPGYLDAEAYAPHMGKPLRHVPAPDANGRPTPGTPTPENNMARTYGNEFVDVIHRLGFNANIAWASDFYDAGFYDKWMVKACEHPDKIRAIYERISGSEKGEEWNPLQIVCERCGKVGSTTVTEFDGKEATYRCEPSKVKWAVGCGYEGKTSPFKGRGKLPWKVEWAVKWAGFPRPDGQSGVNVEGSGKDHNAAGGSHDVSEAISREVLELEPPFNIPYEFFLFGGAKMSASKGLGASAKEVSDMFPPELLRFLMVRTRPNQPIDFNIDGDTVPRLYDNHDDCASIYFGEKEDNSDLGRAYHFAQLKPAQVGKHFFPRFSRIAFTVQLPHLDIYKEVEAMKGAPLTDADREETKERSEYAREWLEQFAGENARFEIQKEVPDLARDLTSDQKEFLHTITTFLKANVTLTGEALHTQIHELRKASPLEAREAFGAIYAALLGKNSGPQAGWFLEALERPFVIERFETVAALPLREKKKIEDAIAPLNAPLIIIRAAVCEKFPGIKLGFNTMKGLKIHKSLPNMADIQKELWAGLDFKELRDKSPRLEAFREIYKGFGVKPSQNKPSPVALISRLSNDKLLPNINVAVDLYNALAVKHQLAIGLFDLDKIKLPIELTFAKGGEMFHPLTGDKPGPLMPGELCYFDAGGLVMARDFNYLDSDLAKVTEETTNLLLNVDGNQACMMAEVEACLAELETLLQKYCGGTLGERVNVSAVQ
jgi:lysyl-tRNA synthetase class 1